MPSFDLPPPPPATPPPPPPPRPPDRPALFRWDPAGPPPPTCRGIWLHEADAPAAGPLQYPYVCHAEANAILNSTAKGKKIYVTLFPCNECAKLVIQSGIREVIFYEDKNVQKALESPTKGGLRADPAYEASRRLLALAGVKLRQHRPKQAVSVTFGGGEDG